MDWFSLANEILARKKQEVTEEEEEEEKIDSTSEDSPRDAFDEQKELEPLEAAAVASVLEMASLQLLVADVAACDSSPETSNAFARQKVADVIKETEEEIRSSRTFGVLFKKVREEKEARRASKMLKKSMLSNRHRLEDLKRKLNEHESTKHREMNSKQETIASLKDKIHEEITKNDVKLRYVSRWEAARQGQNRIRCRMAEAQLEEKLKETADRCRDEIRVHHEMLSFLTLEEKMLVEEEERWKKTYEKEMKRRTEKIKWLESKKKEQQILVRELKQLLEDRRREIDDFLEFKEKLEKERERERILDEKAVKIQAWWRGTMVRRGLGPFKRKKKLPKDKKKK